MRRKALLAGHLGARRAIRAVSPPGAAWSRLAELGEDMWAEVVAWEQRATFDRALERSPDDPTARGWFELAEPGWTIVIGELPSLPPDPPPREGALALEWGVDPDADGADPPWSMTARTDGRTLVEPGGWVEGEPVAVRVTVNPRAPARGPGRIADAVDDAEESSPS